MRYFSSELKPNVICRASSLTEKRTRRREMIEVLDNTPVVMKNDQHEIFLFRIKTECHLSSTFFDGKKGKKSQNKTREVLGNAPVVMKKDQPVVFLFNFCHFHSPRRRRSISCSASYERCRNTNLITTPNVIMEDSANSREKKSPWLEYGTCNIQRIIIVNQLEWFTDREGGWWWAMVFCSIGFLSLKIVCVN